MVINTVYWSGKHFRSGKNDPSVLSMTYALTPTCQKLVSPFDNAASGLERNSGLRRCSVSALRIV